MERARNISKSMLSYLKRAREQKEFLLKETREFERGKRHLANMMGIESQEMTQDDVDKAIKYLFPSGLFDPRARPMMKHPDLLFKAQKDAQFDSEGRPHHYLFYTVKPNYFDALNKIGQTIRELNDHEDKQLAKGIIDPPSEANFTLSGKVWLDHHEVCDKFLEKIDEADYDYLVKCLTQLAKHPYSAKAQSFIEQYLKELVGQTINLNLPEIIRDTESGQIYTDMVVRRREHHVQVKTVLNGSGKIDIEGQDILYFDYPYYRKAILFPLQVSGMLDRIDIFARVVMHPIKIGRGSVACAVREGVSQSIAAFVDKETRERMRIAGLLTIDQRLRERKKFGQAKARRKYTWKKR